MPETQGYPRSRSSGSLTLNNASRPRGSVGIAAFLTSLTDCRWWFDTLLVREKTQDRRPAERQRARTKKNLP